MTRKVWKFKVAPHFSLKLPFGWDVVDVATQDADAYLWILLDPDLPKHEERFVTLATGQDVPDGADPVGTFHMPGLVFHVFVLGGPA